MLNVFVLEDNLQHQTRIERAILDAAKEHQIELNSFEIFSKPEKLLTSITERGNHNLFFLDLEINGSEQKGFDDRAAVETETDFVFTNAQNQIVVKFNDLIYFETSPTIHKVLLRMSHGEVEFYGKVSEIAKADHRLYQTYRSFVVNPKKVKEVDKKQQVAIMETGDCVPISRTKMKGLIHRIEELSR